MKLSYFFPPRPLVFPPFLTFPYELYQQQTNYTRGYLLSKTKEKKVLSAGSLHQTRLPLFGKRVQHEGGSVASSAAASLHVPAVAHKMTQLCNIL